MEGQVLIIGTVILICVIIVVLCFLFIRKKEKKKIVDIAKDLEYNKNLVTSTPVLLELSKIENIVGIKEASGNISQVAQISALCGDDLPIYSGNDDQILPILSLGGQGVISVLSNINPSLALNITNSFWSGNINDAKNYQLKALPIINALFEETNPIPVKEALNLLGFNFGTPRLPLVQCSESLTEKLNKLINTV